MILFLCLTPKNDQSNFITALENYKMAGFKAPTTLIIDQNIEMLEAFDKLDFKPKNV
jgi:hypothetical protein